MSWFLQNPPYQLQILPLEFKKGICDFIKKHFFLCWLLSIDTQFFELLRQEHQIIRSSKSPQIVEELFEELGLNDLAKPNAKVELLIAFNEVFEL